MSFWSIPLYQRCQGGECQHHLRDGRVQKERNLQGALSRGCMAQRYKEEILQEVPEVDGILGTTGYDEVSKVLAEGALR